MSARGSKGYADPQGKTYEVTQYGITQAVGQGAPTGVSGFAPSCTYQNLTATVAGTFFYVNTGTVVTAIWTNVL